MEKRKNIITTVVIIAILLLGVGYSSIQSQNLVISGIANATTSDTNFNVCFTGTPTTTNGASATGGTTTATIDTTNDSTGRTATIAVSGLTTTGQTATATYTITNNSNELSATVAVGTIANSNTDYFEVTTDWSSSKTIAAKGSEKITVTVKLLKTPTDDKTATISVPITATPVEK